MPRGKTESGKRAPGGGRRSKRGGPTEMVNARVLASARDALIAEAAAAGKESLSEHVADILEAHVLKG